MGRWDKEFANNLDRKGSDGYPKKKGRLKVKLLLFIPAMVLLYGMTAFFTIALNWNPLAAISLSGSVVLTLFGWIYLSYLDNKV